MFKLNFKIALRNIWKNRTSSLINISGLAIGLAACLILLLYVSYEWNFDSQTIDPENTFKVLMNDRAPDKSISGTIGATTNAIAPLLKQDYPAVNAVARIDDQGKRLIASGQQSFKRIGCFADPDLLKIFDYTFIAGNSKTALAAPYQVIVTEATARALFGTTDVLNRAVRFDNKTDLKITGVIKDLPGNTSVYFDFLMPWSLDEALNDWIKEPSWGNYNYRTVVRMNPGTGIGQFNEGLKGVMKKHASWNAGELFLFPLQQLHLSDTFKNGISVGGRKEQLRLFMALAVGILLIACINFMNMATAKSEKRAKEVGIKKTIGATRSSLVVQFLMESMVLTVLSTVIAIVLIELSVPWFNRLLEIELTVNYQDIYIWIGLVTVILLTGFISGSYPALYLSSFNPVQILRKRNIKGGWFSINLRQVLVVGQFCFAVILMLATAVIYKQIQYLKNRPIGYEVNELVQLPQEGELYGKFEWLKDRLIKSGAVVSLCQMSGTIADQTSSFSGMDWKGASEKEKRTEFAQIATTNDFITTNGMKLVAGRDFSVRFASDSAGLLISASAAKLMNLPHPIGEMVYFHGEKRHIVGIFEDFILGSPNYSGAPLIVAFMKGWGGTVTMRLNTANPAAANLAAIAKIVKEINPAYPVDISFVDQLYADKLKDQKVLGILSNLFGGLAIFISCLGLFGLAAYSAEQRTKEIGVRKVLGASVNSLMKLLSFSFLKMVVIAIVIAVPVADQVMTTWLKGFEFHTSVSWVIILLSAIGTLGIAALTVSFQAYKAAKANPVDALKYE